jgi:hypothetical protein
LNSRIFVIPEVTFFQINDQQKGHPLVARTLTEKELSDAFLA